MRRIAILPVVLTFTCLISTLKLQAQCPTAININTQETTCGNNNGKIYLGTVSGGTAPFLYNINGSAFSSDTIFNNLAPGNYTVQVKDANSCIFTAPLVTINNIGGITGIDVSIIHETCNSSNGEIHINNVFDSIRVFCYCMGCADCNGSLESGNWINLPHGNYVVHVQDSIGCAFNDTLEIQNIATYSADITVIDETCTSANGSISINSVFGGQGPYQYNINNLSWSNTTLYENLSSGNYSLKIKDANGCNWDTSFVLNDFAGPTNIFLSTMDATCELNNGNISLGSVVGGTAPYSFSLQESAFSPQTLYENLFPGSYTLEVMDDKGCIFSLSDIVIVEIPPIKADISISNSTCQGNNGSIAINASEGSPFWSFSDGTTVFNQYQYSIDWGIGWSTEKDYYNLSPGTYYPIVKDAAGCIWDSIVIIVDTTIIPDVSAGPDKFLLCDGGNVVLEGSSATPGATFNWNGASIISGSFIPNAITDVAGTYTLTVTDPSSGCINTDEVIVYPPSSNAKAYITTTPDSCPFGLGTMRIDSVTGAVPPYLFSVDGSVFSDQTYYENIVSGAYTLTIRDSNFCTVSQNFIISNALNGPWPITANDTVICEGELVTLTTSGAVSYSWSPAAGLSATSGAMIDASPLTTTTYLVEGNDSLGCARIGSITIYVNPKPDVNASPQNIMVCEGGWISLTANGANSYEWNSNNNLIGIQANLTYSPLTSEIITITGSSSFGCTSTDTVTIIVNPLPVVSIMADDTTICLGGCINLTASGAATYQWSPSINVYPSPNAASIATCPFYTTTYTIIGTSQQGCVSTEAVTIYVLPFEAEITTVDGNCTSGGGSIIIDSIINGTAPYQYSLNGQSFSDSSILSNLPSGIYDLEIKESNGCIYSESGIIINDSIPIEIAFSTKKPSCPSGCDGEAEAIISGGSSPYSYSWSNGETNSIANGLCMGNYELIVQDSIGCTKIASFSIENSISNLNFSVDTTSSQCLTCNGAISITNLSGGVEPYLYSIDDSTFNSLSEFTNLCKGNYNVSVKDSLGCIKSVNNQIKGILSASSVAEQSNCINSIDLTVSGGTTPYVYYWSNGATTEDLNNIPMGIYTVYISDSNNCTGILRDTTINNNSCNDLSIYYLSSGNARPGMSTHYYMNLKNKTNNSTTGKVYLVHDPVLNYSFSSIPPSSISGDTLFWDSINFSAYQNKYLIAYFMVPPDISLMGYNLYSCANIEPLGIDVFPANNSSCNSRIITNSYDPNDKSVVPDGDILITDTLLTYTINFQNTGTDTAFNIVVADTLSAYLDTSTITLIGASHEYTFELTNDGIAKWHFNNILLPDSNVNEPGSHGQIVFSIQTKQGLSIGTEIENSADIYFDFNPPVITNSTLNKIIEPSNPKPWSALGTTWYYSEHFSFSSDISYLKIESVADTVINGITCRKLQKSGNLLCHNRPNVEYVYEVENKIYFWDYRFNEFQKLYDFDANTGSSWIIKVVDLNNIIDTITVTIDSLSITNINGHDLKLQQITYSQHSDFMPISGSSRIIERIGDLGYLFNLQPVTNVLCDGNSSGGLRCFEDSLLGLYSTGIAPSCTFTGIEIIHNKENVISIYPNPFSGITTVKSNSGNGTFSLFDILGKELKSMQINNPETKLNCSDLPAGIYFYKFTNEKSIQSGKLIVK